MQRPIAWLLRLIAQTALDRVLASRRSLRYVVVDLGRHLLAMLDGIRCSGLRHVLGAVGCIAQQLVLRLRVRERSSYGSADGEGQCTPDKRLVTKLGEDRLVQLSCLIAQGTCAIRQES